MGFVTLCIVRSPVTLKLLGPVRITFVELNFIHGSFSASKNSSENSCPLSSLLVVSIWAIGTFTSSLVAPIALGSKASVPVAPGKVPQNSENPMWSTPYRTRVSLVVTSYVPGGISTSPRCLAWTPGSTTAVPGPGGGACCAIETAQKTNAEAATHIDVSALAPRATTAPVQREK